MASALESPGSAHRGASAGAAQAERVASELRRGLATAIGQVEPRRVILTPGATCSINAAIQGVWLAGRGRRLRVVTTQGEHNAARRPLLALAQRGEIELVVLPVDEFARVDADAVIAAASDGGAADLVVMSSASNVTGVRQPVDRVWSAVHGTRTLLMVDASQTAGPGCGLVAGDLIAFGAHKRFAGPPGIGALMIGERAHPLVVPRESTSDARGGESPRIEPAIVGGAGHSSQDVQMPAGLPERFEAGTLNTPAMAGWLAAIGSGGGGSAGGDSARALAERLRRGLRRVKSVRVFAPPDAQTSCESIVSFTIAGFKPDEAAVVLESEFGIVVRAGLHCAPGAHEAMGTLETGGTIRASFGSTTTAAGVDALIEAMMRMARPV